MEGKICVIIPGKGILYKLEECLKSILNSAYSEFEVIFVNDGLDESSENVLKRYDKKIRILNSYGKGPCYARNLATKNTEAEFVAFTDSDCVVDKNWLGELLRGFKKHPKAVACGGIQKLPGDATNFEKKVFLFMRKVGFITDYMRKVKGDNVIEVNHTPSCNVMYKRDIFLKEGGFLEGLWPGEDVEFDYRLKRKGYKIVFNPKAVVYHYRPRELKTFLKMMYRYGWAQGFLARKYGFFRRIQILPFLNVLILSLFLLSLLLKFSLQFLILILVWLLFLLVYFNFNPIIFALAVLSLFSWNLGFFKNLFKTNELFNR
jgi:cellulose synthase/poly-beta-1,6-N-acetylglucosamine synthase-like glycosyltransferase